jgi:hypothetical protein
MRASVYQICALVLSKDAIDAIGTNDGAAHLSKIRAFLSNALDRYMQDSIRSEILMIEFYMFSGHFSPIGCCLLNPRYKRGETLNASRLIVRNNDTIRKTMCRAFDMRHHCLSRTDLDVRGCLAARRAIISFQMGMGHFVEGFLLSITSVLFASG